MGVFSLTSIGRFGFSDSESSEWTSSTSLRCLASHGTARSRRLAITASDRGSGSSTYVLSYNAPSMNFLDIPGNRARTGSASVTVRGAFFGNADVTLFLRALASACEDTQWNSDTSMKCLSGQGSGGSHKVIVLTSAAQDSSATSGFSYNSARVSGMLMPNRFATGSAVVTLTGSNIGMTDNTAIPRGGGTRCEMTLWDSDSSTRALMSAGIQGSRRMTITAGARGGTQSEMYSNDVGVISIARSTNSANTGSSSVTVHGASMGLVTYTGRAREGHTGCEATEWKSETSGRHQFACIHA